MATTPREWANNARWVRDDGAEFTRGIIQYLEKVTTNEVDDKEEIEGIVGKAASDLYVLLRALEQAGANTSPANELKNRLDQMKRLSLVPA